MNDTVTSPTHHVIGAEALRLEARRQLRLTLEQGLPQFIGTEEWHRHLGNLIYTDGVRFLAETAGAYWLVDIIASYQPKLAREGSAFGGWGIPFQIWRLVVDLEHTSAVITCHGDWDDERPDEYPAIVRQEIEFTDFPLPEMMLYCERGAGHMVLMLPGER